MNNLMIKIVKFFAGSRRLDGNQQRGNLSYQAIFARRGNSNGQFPLRSVKGLHGPLCACSWLGSLFIHKRCHRNSNETQRICKHEIPASVILSSSLGDCWTICDSNAQKRAASNPKWRQNRSSWCSFPRKEDAGELLNQNVLLIFLSDCFPNIHAETTSQGRHDHRFLKPFEKFSMPATHYTSMCYLIIHIYPTLPKLLSVSHFL